MSDELYIPDDIKVVSKEELAIALDIFGIEKNKEETQQEISKQEKTMEDNQDTPENSKISFENLVKELEESNPKVS